MKDTPKFKFVFLRERHIESGDFAQFIELFTPPKTTPPQALRLCCNSLRVHFHGYKNEKRLPFLIPDLREFIRKLRKSWPYAPYFCDLDSSFLSLEAMACFDHFTILEWDDSGKMTFQINTKEISQYLGESNEVIERLGKQAGMTALEITNRKKQVSDYLWASLLPGD